MSDRYDVLIVDARIVDGTGRAAFTGSIGIRGEKIAALGEIGGDADRVIDGSGLVACPGFVDPHSHADGSILEVPLAENLVMQGITTFVGGNCGLSTAPVRGTDLRWKTFGEWLSRVEEGGLSVNYVPLVGHNAVREAVLGDDYRRRASESEIDEMRELVDEAMASGAFGLSAGLDAAWPGHFASVEEIVTLAMVARQYGGLFAPHTRHHQNQWPASHPEEFGYGIFHAPTGEAIVGRYHGLLEAIEIARKADNIPLLIAHLTPAYIVPQPHPGFLDEALARATLIDIIDKPRSEGMDVTYSVIAWSQSIASEAPLMASFLDPSLLLPEWLKTLGKAEFAEKLKTRAFREKVRGFVYSGKFKMRMIHPLTDPYWMDCIQIVRCQNTDHVGRTIGEIARKRAPHSVIKAVYEASIEAVFDILVEDPDTTCADFIDKREVGALPTFLQHPAGMPCTDVEAYPAAPPPMRGLYSRGISPTAYGLYPHYIRTFVKEKGVLSLEAAIQKATSLPAQEVLGLGDRGVLKEGAYADIVVFDLGAIREGEDFLEPAQPPEGIEHVLVNGTVVYEGRTHTGRRPGRVLRRS